MSAKPELLSIAQCGTRTKTVKAKHLSWWISDIMLPTIFLLSHILLEGMVLGLGRFCIKDQRRSLRRRDLSPATKTWVLLWKWPVLGGWLCLDWYGTESCTCRPGTRHKNKFFRGSDYLSWLYLRPIEDTFNLPVPGPSPDPLSWIFFKDQTWTLINPWKDLPHPHYNLVVWVSYLRCGKFTKTLSIQTQQSCSRLSGRERKLCGQQKPHSSKLSRLTRFTAFERCTNTGRLLYSGEDWWEWDCRQDLILLAVALWASRGLTDRWLMISHK